MNFKEYYNLNERFGLDAMYVPPKDKQYQLYDFYALSLINPNAFMDEEAKDYFKQAKESIIDATYKDFVNALFFSIASEIFHMEDSAYFSRLNRKDIKDFYNLTDKEMKFVEKMFEDNSAKSREERNKIVRHEFSPQELANFATKIFAGNPKASHEVGENDMWEEGYGGKAWWNIAKGYNRLLNAKSIPDKMVAIDHVYDLQHNSNTVFDKVRDYYKSGYSWLKDSLDDKAQIKDPHVYIDKTSPQLFRPLAYAFKQLYGKTIESFKKEQSEKYEKDIIEFMDKNGIDHSLSFLVDGFFDALEFLNKYKTEMGLSKEWIENRKFRFKYSLIDQNQNNIEGGINFIIDLIEQHVNMANIPSSESKIIIDKLEDIINKLSNLNYFK